MRTLAAPRIIRLAAMLIALGAAGAVVDACAASASSRPHRAASGATATAPAFASAGAPLSGYALGADIAPSDLLPGWRDQPTGRRLVELLARDHLRFVRLLDSPPTPQPWLATRLAGGGWKTVFDELAAARIRAVLLLTGAYTPRGQPTGKVWAPEGPVLDGQAIPAPPAREMSTAAWDANEAAIIGQIRSQSRGHLPRALAGVEIANEPTVDAATLPMLARALRAMRRQVRGVPVTIGGWRAPDPATGRIRYNQPGVTSEVAPLVDFVSVHLYPDNEVRLPGGQPERNSTRSSTYLPYATSYLATVLSKARHKPVVVGEFGGRSGLAYTPSEGPAGSPAHQAAVIRAVTEAMAHFADRGLTGGTVWLLEPHEGTGQRCDTFALICYQPHVVLPALRMLVGAPKQAAHRGRRKHSELDDPFRSGADHRP